MSSPAAAGDGRGLPAIGPLRDFPSSQAGPAPTTPRLDPALNAKIRNLCFLLSIAVVFNHAITAGELRDWLGQSPTGPPREDLTTHGLETLLQHFLSGSLGRITNPVFFATSSYLFFWAWRPDWESLKRKWRRRAFTLLVPLLIWAMAGKALWLVDHVLVNRRALGTMISRGEWGWSEALLTFSGMNVPSQLWFLEQLVWLMLLVVPLLVWALPRLGWWVFLIALGIYWLPGQETVWLLRKAPLCYFTWGAVLGYFAHPLKFPGRRWAWRTAVFWLLTAAGFTALAVWGGVRLAPFLKGLVLVGMVGAWGAYDLLPPRLISLVGRVAPYRFFVYMGFDPLLPILQRHGYGWFSGSEALRVVSYFLFPTVTIALCLITARGLHRWVPSAYFLITGGRSPALPDGLIRGTPGRPPSAGQSNG